MPAIALFEPEIAGNVGAIIRTNACFAAPLHIIEPCGFPFDVQRVKRSALDYIDHVRIINHSSFENFFQQEIIARKSRLVLATTKGNQDYSKFDFKESDIILFGKESAGVPDSVRQKSDAQIFIPMQCKMRSLNIAISCGIILSHAVNVCNAN